MNALALMLLLAAHAPAAPRKGPVAKKDALEAVAACTGGPAVDASTAAARPARDEAACAAARRTLMGALQRAPHDKELAGAALDLNAAGWFELSEKAKKRLRVTAGRAEPAR